MVVRLCGIALAAAFFVQYAFRCEADDHLNFAIGLRGNWASAAAEMADVGGYHKRNGITVETIYTQGAGETLQAVISHPVDFGVGLGMHSVMGAFGKGAPIRVVGSVATGNNDLFWYAKSDSPLHSLKDATPKTTVGYSTTGSSSHIVLLKLTDFGVHCGPLCTSKDLGPNRQKLNEAIHHVMERPDVTNALLRIGFENGAGTPDALIASLLSDGDRWIPVAKNLSVRLD